MCLSTFALVLFPDGLDEHYNMASPRGVLSRRFREVALLEEHRQIFPGKVNTHDEKGK